jgi:hypothetical protein
MTPEQEKQVKEIKKRAWEYINYGFIGERNGEQSAVDRATLLAIVDDLRKQLTEKNSTIEVNAKYCIELQGIIQKQQPTQYTEAELRAEFDRQNLPNENDIGEHNQHGYCSDAEGDLRSRGWLECARFMGAIKE